MLWLRAIANTRRRTTSISLLTQCYWRGCATLMPHPALLAWRRWCERCLSRAVSYSSRWARSRDGRDQPCRAAPTHSRKGGMASRYIGWGLVLRPEAQLVDEHEERTLDGRCMIQRMVGVVRDVLRILATRQFDTPGLGCALFLCLGLEVWGENVWQACGVLIARKRV
ncbi:hypothetical protein OH77DRAFT_283516 [Trametes cingulata]|nr:hypothetical protein OH77DRAFT_283516 [Trametes cingulata]